MHACIAARQSVCKKCEIDGESCLQCGLGRLCQLVLVTGKDEESERLGDSDEEDLSIQDRGDWKTYRTRTCGLVR